MDSLSHLHAAVVSHTVISMLLTTSGEQLVSHVSEDPDITCEMVLLTTVCAHGATPYYSDRWQQVIPADTYRSRHAMYTVSTITQTTSRGDGSRLCMAC